MFDFNLNIFIVFVLLDKPSAHEIYTLVNALGSLFRSRTRKNYLESLLREPNKLADVLAPLPEIKNDPVCFGNSLFFLYFFIIKDNIESLWV